MERRQEEEVKAFHERYNLKPWEDKQDEDAEEEGVAWSAFAELEKFHEREVGDAFMATRTKGKGHQELAGTRTREKEKQQELEEMVDEMRNPGKRGENMNDLPKTLPNFERAYANGSRIADPQAAEKLVNRMPDMVIPNITAHDILSLSGDARKLMVEHLRVTRTPIDPNSNAKAQVHNITSQRNQVDKFKSNTYIFKQCLFRAFQS